MKITITTTSQRLDDILTQAQQDQIEVVNNRTVLYTTLIQNTGSANVYLELGAEASPDNSYILKPNEESVVAIYDLLHLNLIADSNNEVRLLIV